MRSDARRNHDHILEAARELFAESGTKVSVDEIARAAGVGVGKVHRHFPTKDDLVGAVLVWSCEPVLDALEEALKGDDPLTGLETFLLQVVEFQDANRALAEEFRDEGHAESPELAEIKAKMTSRLTELVHRSQAADELRDDVGPGDLRLLLMALGRDSAPGSPDVTLDDRLRFLRIVLDGLCTPEPSPLPGTPPEL
jgi:AcrR family transcriptional regulator